MSDSSDEDLERLVFRSQFCLDSVDIDDSDESDYDPFDLRRLRKNETKDTTYSRKKYGDGTKQKDADQSTDQRKPRGLGRNMPNRHGLGKVDSDEENEYDPFDLRRLKKSENTQPTDTRKKHNDGTKKNDKDQSTRQRKSRGFQQEFDHVLYEGDPYDLRRLRLIAQNIQMDSYGPASIGCRSKTVAEESSSDSSSSDESNFSSRYSKGTHFPFTPNFDGTRDSVRKKHIKKRTENGLGMMNCFGSINDSDDLYSPRRLRIEMEKAAAQSMKAPPAQNLSLARRRSDNDSSSGSDTNSYRLNAVFNNRLRNIYGISKTVRSEDYEGNVKIAEICYYSVTGTCRNENKGCSRLHAQQHYYWQISEHTHTWYNLPISFVNALENAYCDPTMENISLPQLDRGCDGNIRQLLKQRGHDKWMANFEAMIMVNSDHSKMFSLRRLCTEKIHGQLINSNTFLWYFKDINSKWVEYGKVDTTGKGSNTSSIMSSNIEQHFLSTPNVPLTFTASNCTYVLDMNAMCQTNKISKVSREVRRRPASQNFHNAYPFNPYIHHRRPGIHHVIPNTNPTQVLPHHPHNRRNKIAFATINNVPNSHNMPTLTHGVPASWEAMEPNERVRRVVLPPSSPEHQKVVGLLGRTVSGKITQVERIQNPCLWRAFQNKVDDMTLAYSDVSKVDIRQLFHGTRHDVVDNIIKENFDWRLHGTSTGQAYGRGTYFSTEASYSYRYCQGDGHGNKFLFVARVAVGTITRGDSSMARPPINPSTKAPYDSTGSGNIIVKYDKQEYYPEYIVTMR